MTFQCWQSQESIATIFSVTPITEARYQEAFQKSDADLVAHLHWQQTSLSNAEETLLLLQECLSCYGFSSAHSLLSLTSRRVMERHLDVWPSGFSQGLEMTLIIDEDCFQEQGVYLFGRILAGFFSKSVSLHSFIRFVLCSVQRGEVGRWGPA
jgi:type VI secretion system protein ImpG